MLEHVSETLLYEARRRDKVHRFHNLQECTDSSGVKLAILDDVFICGEGAQHDVGANDCDIVGVWAAGKRVRLNCTVRDVLVVAGLHSREYFTECTCGIVPLGIASLCGIAQLGMFSLVVCFLAHPVGCSSAWTVTSLSASQASKPRYTVSSPKSTTVFPCSSCRHSWCPMFSRLPVAEHSLACHSSA